jgi:hypothetical protein
VQSYADFLIKDFQNILVRAALQHLTMDRQAINGGHTSFGRLQLEHRIVRGTVIARVLARHEDMLDLVHEHIEPGVETLGYCVVERCLEPFLLTDYGVEKIPLVNVAGLFTTR